MNINNRSMQGRRGAEQLQKRYPVGTRIELRGLGNNEAGMEAGLKGTVVGADDQPALLMRWDNGRTLSLLPSEDSFFIIPEGQPEKETQHDAAEAQNGIQGTGPRLL